MAKLNKIPVVLPTKTGATEEKALAKCYGEKILKSAVGAQAHATLEIGPTSSYPHVYMFAGTGNAKK